MLWPWEYFFRHRIHGVHTIACTPVCNGLLYIAVTNLTYHLHLEDTVPCKVYTLHGDVTDRQYRSVEKRRPTRAVELTRRYHGRPKFEICYRHKRYSASCMNQCGSCRTDCVSVACNVWGCARVTLCAPQRDMHTLCTMVTPSEGWCMWKLLKICFNSVRNLPQNLC